MRQNTRGYTLYELLMTLTLVALIVGLGLPSFSGLAARAGMHVEINALFHAIHVARKESIMRKRIVSLCPSLDGLSCETRPGLVQRLADVRKHRPRRAAAARCRRTAVADAPGGRKRPDYGKSARIHAQSHSEARHERHLRRV